MFNNSIKEASASSHLSYSLVVPFVLRLHVLLIPQRTSLLTVLSPFQEEQIISYVIYKHFLLSAFYSQNFFVKPTILFYYLHMPLMLFS